MLIQRASDIPSSEITPEKLYRNRREFIKAASIALAATTARAIYPASASAAAPGAQQLPENLGPYDTDEKPTPYEDITTYNNYYEFGIDKADPSRNAHTLETTPWSIAVEGAVKNPAVYALEDLIKGFTMEDRIYRMRCVEGWSMVIPWYGFSLGALIRRLEPTAAAKYVEFQTAYKPDQMPGLSRPILEWPYTEGLRMDEAMHPLTILAVGVYGKSLLNQNGAPIRLVVPWKYGFKGAKSIAKIRFVEREPRTAWSIAIPNEYGFYSNVNPEVDHPRWSQATERRIGDFFRRETLMFNGYAEQVAHLYAGMDLRKYY